MDVEILSRLQFAFTVSFHYIYPPLSIGLGLLMVIMEGMYLRTGNKEYETMARFWTRIFALTFAIGVATGIVMEFEFGTNWAKYSRYVGDVFGSALAAEGIFAFALESGFLGVLLFGWNKVKPKVHFIATIGVFIGSVFSAVWIVVANSWQQTPAGYHIVGEGMQARAEITDFWAMVFNPSSVDRLLHVWLGAFLAGSFLVLSVHAWYLLRDRYVELSRKTLKMALVVATVAAVLQLASGHQSAHVVAEHQPAKLAAFEGHFEESAPGDLYLIGWVDKEAQKVVGIKLPGGLSFLVDWNFTTPLPGLNAFAEDERPTAINTIFQFYHIMVAIGLLLIAITLYGTIQWWRGKIFYQRWYLWVLVFSVFLPQVSNQFGWYAAEMGRQPWVVWGHLRTADALSESVTAGNVLFSLVFFTLVYLLLFVLFIYLLNKKIKKGPYDESDIEDRLRLKDIAVQFDSTKSKS
ncbi:MAG TPA: cytochrome ubiquinol oxidase subunit I [Bacteroidales bacterium]|nr:cytochrome ubiquinol oxidase subunit I [Bacteroidales bacterium]